MNIPDRVTATAPQLLDDSQAQKVLAELGRILAGPTFRSSKRCQEFLRYVVEETVAGRAERLKERTVGMELFGRGPDYDPSSDAIVRVRASEVRRRLAQHYEQTQEPGALRIDLPPGSYIPDFRWAPAQVAPAPVAPGVPRSGRRWWPAALLLLPVAAGLAGWAMWPAASAFAEFWRPMVESSHPVVVCLGQPVVYTFSKRVHEQYAARIPQAKPRGPYVLPLAELEFTAQDILPVPDQYVGAGSAAAAMAAGNVLARFTKRSQLRIGNEFSAVDLKNNPVLLVGAFSNAWSLHVQERFPFRFVQEKSRRGIREMVGERREWFLDALQGNGRTPEDYAIVVRTFDAGTHEPLMMVAGVTQYGTQAAAEFVSSETEMEKALAQAPADWARKNIQLLLRVSVMGNTPGRAQFVALHTW